VILPGLMAAQALALSSAPLMVFVGGLIGASLHSDPSLATLPVAVMIIGMASGVWPAARLSALVGRRRLFTGAMILGALAAVAAGLAVQAGSFWGFTLASFAFGLVGAVVQQFRFLAMSLVPADQQASAASKLLLAGLVSAFIGPELATLADFWPELGYLASFLGLSGYMLAAALILFFVVPDQTQINSAGPDQPPRTWPQLLKQPDLVLAMSSAAVAYVVMAFVMTATPLSMTTLAGHSVAEAKWIIQAHIVAMFLPSLLTGRLVNRFGLYPVMRSGLLILLISLIAGYVDASLLHYGVALVALGLGWNFLFVTGTALLARCYTERDAAKVQGANDLLVFGTQAVGSLASGAVLLVFGWQSLLLIAGAGVIWLLAVILWHRQRMVS